MQVAKLNFWILNKRLTTRHTRPICWCMELHTGCSKVWTKSYRQWKNLSKGSCNLTLTLM